MQEKFSAPQSSQEGTSHPCFRAYSLRELGRCMRFFLNATAFLTLIFWIFLQWEIRPLTIEFVVFASIPIVTAALFFLVFLRRLKLVEKRAAAMQDIDLVSRSIWELNKSWIIRSLVGKIPTFIEESNPQDRKDIKHA